MNTNDNKAMANAATTAPQVSPAPPLPNQAVTKITPEDIIITTATGPVKLADYHPDCNERYDWNDKGAGYLFADVFKSTARYVPERKKWYIYDGRVWVPDDLKAMELCKALADALLRYACCVPAGDMTAAFIKYANRWQTRRSRETILLDAASVYPVKVSEFDKNPYLLNCQNGTLDLRAWTFHRHTPADMLTKMAGVSFDSNARCDRWEQHIDEVMSGDQEKALYLQKAMGYTLTGDTSQECFFVLFGPTSRNGKGLTMETYMALMGDYGKSAKPDTIAQKQTANGSGPSEDIARLAGARFANISEPDKNMVLSSALVKTLTGNDTVNARYLHENSFEFRPQFKLFINTNYLPRVNDKTIFRSGRVKVIPFDRHFEEWEQDKGLKVELTRPENLSGILNWCIAGLQLMRQTGFDTPASVLTAIEQYQHDSDKIMQFMEEYMEEDPNGEIPTQFAYSKYKDWCIANSFKIESMPNFKKGMMDHVTIERKRPANKNLGTNPLWLIVGYKYVG